MSSTSSQYVAPLVRIPIQQQLINHLSYAPHGLRTSNDLILRITQVFRWYRLEVQPQRIRQYALDHGQSILELDIVQRTLQLPTFVDHLLAAVELRDSVEVTDEDVEQLIRQAINLDKFLGLDEMGFLRGAFAPVSVEAQISPNAATEKRKRAPLCSINCAVRFSLKDKKVLFNSWKEGDLSPKKAVATAKQLRCTAATVERYYHWFKELKNEGWDYIAIEDNLKRISSRGLR